MNPGDQESYVIKKTAGFTEAIYYLDEIPDATRPVIISNDGWEHTKSDIITLHDYAEYGEDS